MGKKIIFVANSVTSHYSNSQILSNFVGEAFSLKIEKLLFQGKSDYQDVMLFEVTFN